MTEAILTNAQGRVIEQLIINTLCPMKHAEEARDIAWAHVNEHDPDMSVTRETILPQKLGPIGSDEVTHVFCSRRSDSDKLWLQMRSLRRNKQHAWIGIDELGIGDDPELIKSLFCTLRGEPGPLLAYLGLDEK